MILLNSSEVLQVLQYIYQMWSLPLQKLVELPGQVFEIDKGDLPEPSDIAAGSEDLVAGSEDLVAVSSAPSKFVSLKLLFFDGVIKLVFSFSFSFPLPFSFLLSASLSGCGSPFRSGNKGGSWPLNRQNTLSTVSLISFPRPLLSKIKSQTDFDAFSRTEALHEIGMGIRNSQETRIPAKTK